MLHAISADAVREIAGLGAAARRAQDRLLDKMINLGHQKDDADKAVTREIEHLDTLDASLDNGPLRQLRDRVASLTPDARHELRAVMLIGRGDFAGNEWEAALTEAQGRPDGGDVARIIDQARLHDYLMKGLYALRLS